MNEVKPGYGQRSESSSDKADMAAIMKEVESGYAQQSERTYKSSASGGLKEWGRKILIFFFVVIVIIVKVRNVFTGRSYHRRRRGWYIGGGAEAEVASAALAVALPVVVVPAVAGSPMVKTPVNRQGTTNFNPL